MTQVDVADPDPTPTTTPWEEYLAAAQSLDAVRREAAAAAAEATYVVSSARAELEALRNRLEHQRARLTGEAIRAGLPAPQLLPTAHELGVAASQVAGDPAAAPVALRQCRQLLDAGDAQLASPPPVSGHRSWRPTGSLLAGLLVGALALLTCFGTLLLLLLFVR